MLAASGFQAYVELDIDGFDTNNGEALHVVCSS